MNQQFDSNKKLINKKILIIDTEKNVLSTYSTLLEGEGFKVDIAMDEPSATDKITNETFAVVIAELYLKGKKTLNLLKHIREIHPEIYIVIVTATFLISESCEEIIDVGVDDYFTKPLSSTALLANIKKGLKRREMVLRNIQLEKRLNTFPPTPSSDKNFLNKVCNKHLFNLKLKDEITRSERYNHSFSLVQFDIVSSNNNNLSKSFDKKLISHLLSLVLSRITRRTDIITQENGNVSLVLVETPIDGAKNFTNRFRDEIKKLNTDKDLQVPCELSELLKMQFHTFPEQAEYIQHLTKFLKD